MKRRNIIYYDLTAAEVRQAVQHWLVNRRPPVYAKPIDIKYGCTCICEEDDA